MKEYPCWQDSAPPWTAIPVPLPDRIDVVVIGAGCTGLAAARAVARGGGSVAVLDKAAFGDGGSARSAGLVRAGLRPGARDLAARYGRQRAKVLFGASLDAIASLQRLIADERIACDCECVGQIQAADSAARFEAFRTEQEVLARDFNHRVDLVPASLQDTEIGTTSYHGLLVDADGLVIHPLKDLHGLACAAIAAGARLHERTAVTRVTRAGVGFKVTAAGRTIIARDVIAATAGYTDAALPALRRRMVPGAVSAIATAPLPPDLTARLLPRRRMVSDTATLPHCFRLSDDNRLVFGRRSPGHRANAAGSADEARLLQREMSELFPALRDVPVEYAWSGRVDLTRDMLPHAGLVDGIHYAVGYGEHGIALATWLGTSVGECVLGRQADTPFHDLRFDAIPLYNGRPWFLPFAGLYYRWKDLVS